MKKLGASLVFFILLFFSGCKMDYEEQIESVYKIYYVDNNETKVVSEPYIPTATTQEQLLKEFVQLLSEEPSDLALKKAKPDTVLLKEYSLNESGQLMLNFDSSYSTMTGISEILSRAAIVKLFCQLEQVKYVEFYVNGQPLMDSNEKPIGLMTKENFIDNTGGETKYKQNATITLFYATVDGTALTETDIKVNYEGAIPMEQLIIEQLIRGTESIKGAEDEQIYPCVNPETALLKVTTKEGICYVDFNEKFLEKLPNVTDEVTIYSIVNSLVEMSSVNKVQFTINGEKKTHYREFTGFDLMFERNLDLVVSKMTTK